MVKPPSQTLQNIQACQKVSTHNLKVHFSPPLNGLIVCVCTIAQQSAVAETSFFSLLVLVISKIVPSCLDKRSAGRKSVY